MKGETITRTQTALQVEESEITLPDESDQIISDLESELEQLRQQVLYYESRQPSISVPPVKTSSEALEIQLEVKRQQVKSLTQRIEHLEWQEMLLPQVVERLQAPVQEITANLDHLISRVQDQELQTILAKCRNMALGAIQQAQKIEHQTQHLHQQELQSKESVDSVSFFKKIVEIASQNHCSTQLLSAAELPPQISVDQNLFRQAILILLKEITRLSGDDQISITLKRGSATYYDVPVDQLEVILAGEASWKIPKSTEMTTFLKDHTLQSKEMGLGLIYAKKIIELHGGSLSLHAESGDVCGFDVSIPVTR